MFKALKDEYKLGDVLFLYTPTEAVLKFKGINYGEKTIHRDVLHLFI